MSAELKTFVQRVIRIAAPKTDIGGAVIPSLSGVVTAGSDSVHTLQMRTMEFAQAYKDGSCTVADLQHKAKAVEGSLMTAVTLGAVDGKDGTQLIDDLQALLERRHNK